MQRASIHRWSIANFLVTLTASSKRGGKVDHCPVLWSSKLFIVVFNGVSRPQLQVRAIYGAFCPPFSTKRGRPSSLPTYMALVGRHEGTGVPQFPWLPRHLSNQLFAVRIAESEVLSSSGSGLCGIEGQIDCIPSHPGNGSELSHHFPQHTK